MKKATHLLIFNTQPTNRRNISLLNTKKIFYEQMSRNPRVTRKQKPLQLFLFHVTRILYSFTHNIIII